MNFLSTFMSAALIVSNPFLVPLASDTGDVDLANDVAGNSLSQVVEVTGTGEHLTITEDGGHRIVVHGDHGLNLTVEAVSEDGEISFSINANNGYTKRLFESENVSYSAARVNHQYLIGTKQMATAKAGWFIENTVNIIISTIAGYLGGPVGPAVAAAVSTLVASVFAAKNAQIDGWIADRTNRGIHIKSRIYPSGLSPNVQVSMSPMKCPKRRGRYTNCQKP